MRNVMVKLGGIAAVIHGLVLPFLAIGLLTQKLDSAKPINAIDLFMNFIFVGGLLPLIVVASLLHLSQPRSRAEYIGCFLAFVASLQFTISNQLLIQNPSLISGSWFEPIFLIGRFGFPIGLALMGLARVRQTGIRDLSRVSKILSGLAVVLFITSAIWRVMSANTLGSDVINQLGMIMFFVERLIWIPLAWVLLSSQKLSIPSRAQPA